MKQASRVFDRFANGAKIRSFNALALYIAVLFGLYLLILFNAKTIGQSIPLLAVGLSWVWFLLPGLLLSHLSAPNISWWERIPAAFVITIGIATPFTVAAILLHVTLNIFIIFHMGSLIISALILIIFFLLGKLPESQPSPAQNPEPEGFRRSSAILLILLIAIGLILSYLGSKWPIAGDDTAVLPLFADVLDQNQISGVEPFHGSEVPVTPRNELIVSTYLEILTNKVAGVLPQDFIQNSRPFLIVIALLSLATLLNHFVKEKRQILFLLCLWGVYLLSSLKADRTGSDFITRIFQDKFLGWFIIVPIAMVFLLRYMETGRWNALITYGIITLGASMVHPITLVQVMILSAGFGLCHYIFNRSRPVFTNLLTIAAVLLFCTFIPFLQYIRYTNYMPVDLVGLGDAVEFGRLAAAVGRYRLWLLDGGRFILHPSVILQPVILAAYALLPLIIIKLRHKVLAQMIIGSMILLPVLLYIPIFAALAGKVVTPFLLWRLAWPLPLFAILTIGSMLWLAAGWIERKLTFKGFTASKAGYLYPGVILLALLGGAAGIWQGVKDFSERRTLMSTATCQSAGNALRFLDQITREAPVNVLSTHELNLCIPGYASNANVVEYRGYGTVNRLSYDNIEESIQRVEDVYYFSGAKLFDDTLLNSLNLHKIDYILIDRDQLDLDLQLHNLPETFRIAYQDRNYRLYSVQNNEEMQKIIFANTALRNKQFDTAIDWYLKVLQEDPDNILAHLGLGIAEEGLGNIPKAIDYYQKAILFAPSEPALHAQLAAVYLLTRDFEKSAEEYRTAIELAPDRADLHRALGNIYVLLNQQEKAKASFERVAALQAVEGTASYYAILGNALQSIDAMTDQAIAYQEKAIAIQPDIRRSISLARTWIASDDTDKAIKELKRAIRQDPWSYLPPMELGYIYWGQGDLDHAIQEFEIACRLNPANISAYVLLGRAIQQRDGTNAAIARLEDLARLNKVLPGPYRSLAIIRATSGELSGALEAIDRSVSIQPKNASVLTSKGYISMIAGQMDDAFEAFDQALTTYPDLISAILGLGMYYNLEADYTLEAGQFHNIVQLEPTASWIHLVIGEMYRQRGDYPAALEEINWAIKLDPDNPEVYIERGDIYKIQSYWSQAISDYAIASNLDPQNYDALLRMGEIYESRADYVKAEALYIQANDVQPNSVVSKSKLANLYWQLGRTAEAQALEDAIQELAPNSSLAMIRAAAGYEKEGKIEEAKLIYAQIIQNSPNLIGAQIGLAQLVEEEDNDLSAVYSIYNNLIGENQNSAEAFLAVGRFLVDQGQFDLAEQTLTNALSFADVSAGNYLALSELQKKRGNYEGALSTMQSATKIFPGDASILSSLGFYYLERGDLANARIYFDKAIVLDATVLEAYAGKSNIERINGHETLAEKVLQQAVANNPGSSQALLVFAGYQESTDQVDLAEASIDKALALNPANFDTNLAAGQFYLRQKRYLEADDRFRTALGLPGSKLEVTLQLGNLALAQGQLVNAIQWYQAAQLEDRSDIRPELALSEAYQVEGKHTDAFAALIAAYQAKPASVEVNLALGELSGKSGNAADARAYLKTAVSLDRSSAPALLALAELDKGEGKWQEAIAGLQMAAALDQTNFQVFYTLAETYQIMGDCSKAEGILSEGIQKTSDKQAGYLGAAAMVERCGNWQAATEYYEQAWREEPASARGGWELVDYTIRRNDLDQTLNALGRIESLVGRNAEVLVGYGNVYAAQAKWPEAITTYQNALAQDANNESAYLGLGKIYENQGKFDAAIEVYRTAAEKLSESANIQLRLGGILQRQGNLEEAKAAYQKASELGPSNFSTILSKQQINSVIGIPGDEQHYINLALDTPISTALTAVGQMLQSEGKWDAASAWFQRAVHNEPLKAENWYWLGNYHRSLGQWEEALAAYTQANKLNPGSSAILTALGQVQEELGLTNDAQSSYRRAIDVQPGGISGYAALAWLQVASGKPDEALLTIQSGIQQAPADYRGYEALGDILISIDPVNNFSKAEEAYRSGLAVLPGNTALKLKIGDLYYSQAAVVWRDFISAGDYANWAKNQYLNLVYEIGTEEEIPLLPRFLREKLEEATLAYEQSQAKLSAAQKEYEKAAAEFEMADYYYRLALGAEPGNVLALTGMGKLRLAQGRDGEAGLYFEEGVAKNPLSVTALLALGNYYLTQGQMDKALPLFEQAVALEPGNRSAQAAYANALHNLPALSISQAVISVEQVGFKLDTLVAGFRQK